MKKGEAMSMALNLSWTMLFSLVIPLLVGLWLDNRFDSSPLFVLLGAGLGVLAATVGVARAALRTFRPIVEEADRKAERRAAERSEEVEE
ncbi:MAG: AtpZ/AtpI family protein [Anaerolineae bacterium]|nr:AtpZ/AtpI family protein [Anaerolineae bacterium]